MKTDEIECPKCGTPIPVTEALRHQLSQHIREELEEKAGEREKELLIKEKELRDKEKQLGEAEKEVDKRVEKGVAAERIKLETDAKKRAEELVSTEVKDMREQLREKNEKLEKAEQAELELRKRERELEQREKNAELEAERRIATERQKVQEETIKAYDEEHRLKDAEKDKRLQDAIRVNDELSRKLQQGSQQTQGEVLELQIEELIRSSFPTDVVEPVPKGVNGADVVHRVYNRHGNSCGVIVWELKHTKAWSDSWIQKLKDDLRLVKGDVAVLVTEVLPKGVENFALVSGIWVTSPSCALGLAMALRGQLVEVATTKLSTVGKNEKMEVLYQYLSGSEFRQRVEAIVESFVDMQKDLQTERRASELRWSKREKQIQRVIANTAGMYGDFQGLMGSSLQTIPALSAGEESANEAPGAISIDSKTGLDAEDEIDPDTVVF